MKHMYDKLLWVDETPTEPGTTWLRRLCPVTYGPFSLVTITEDGKIYAGRNLPEPEGTQYLRVYLELPKPQLGISVGEIVEEMEGADVVAGAPYTFLSGCEACVEILLSHKTSE